MLGDYKVAYLKRHVRVREAKPLSFHHQAQALVLTQAQSPVPQSSAVTTLDMTPMVELCRVRRTAGGHNYGISKSGVPYYFHAFMTKLLAHALYHVPRLNGFFDYTPIRNGGVFYEAEDINLAVTIAVPETLAPVVCNPHLLIMTQIQKRIRKLVKRAKQTDPSELLQCCASEYFKTAIKSGSLCSLREIWTVVRGFLKHRKPKAALATVAAQDKIGPADVLVATCTSTNMGAKIQATCTATPLVPPQVCFFNIGHLHQAPRVIDNTIQPRWVVNLYVGVDHRVIDAGEVYILQSVLADYVKQPERLFDWQPGDPI